MKVYRNGVEIFEIKDYKQIGRFMEVATIDATVKTPTPFEFKIGDYVVFDYNGLTYTIYDVSPEKKQARSGTYGEAFVYDIKFKADTEQLNICPFLDLVPYDNNLTYTSLPSFSTFENVRGIADRLQANMDSLYPGKWRFEVENTDDAELAEVLNEAREFSISGESCLEGLKKVYDTWGVGFIHSVDNGINVITIGKSAGKTSAFRYGKGQGLRTIKKNIQNTDQLCTRAYVYGSTRNIPARWYNEKGYIGESQHAPNLMIPPSKWTGGIPQGAYIDAIFNGEDRIEKYGLKIKTFSYDGSDGNKDEIYPSIEKVTAKIIRDAKAEIGETDNFPSVALYPDNERMDLVLEGTALSDDGIGIEPGYQLYSDKYAAQVYPDTKTYTIAEQTGETKYKLLTLQKSFNLCSFNIEKTSRYKINTEYNNFVKFKKNDLESTVSATLYLQKPSGSSILLRQLAFTDTLEGSLQLPKQEYSLDEVGNYTLVVKFNVSWNVDYVTPQIGETVTLEYSIPTQFNVELARGQKILPQFFTIKIKQIGFDINNYSASSGASKSIHIKSGMCAGRTFGIAQCDYSKDDDSWVLTCKRIDDSSVSQRFPNSMFPVAKDDQFILININMPDLYVHTAMHRLYNTALEDLKHFSKPQYVIEPEIDNLQMARSPQVIKEGMYMPIEDADLSYIEDTLIDSVTITNKGTGIRTFEVALRNDKIYNRYNKLASRIAELESSVQQTVSNATITQAPAEKEDEVIVQNSGISESEVKEITEPIAKDVEELKSFWHFDKELNAVRTPYNLIAEGAIGMKELGESGSVTPASGLERVSITIPNNDSPFVTDAQGNVTLPAYPTVLKNPYALIINGVHYDGSKEITINLEGGGGIADSVAWENVMGRPTALSEFENDLGFITSAALYGYATQNWVSQQGFLTQHQDISHLLSKQDAVTTYATIDSLNGLTESLSVYVDKSSDQTITGVKTFQNGLQIGDVKLVWDSATKALKIIGSAYTTGTFGMGDLGEAGSGGGGAAGIVTVRVNGYDYNSVNGIVTLPNYPSLAGYATESWVGANYLPLSGGELNYAYGPTPLRLVGGSPSETAIGFKRNGENDYAYLVYRGGESWAVSDLGWTKNLYLLHSSNYADYALPLNGGTITGLLYIDSSSSSDQPLALRSNAADASGACRIQFIDANNAFQGYVMSGWGNLLLAHRSYNQIGVGDSGIWCSSDNGTTKNALIHSGNIGSQSVSYASSAFSASKFPCKLNVGFDANSNESLLLSDYGSGNPRYNTPDGFTFGSIFTPLPSNGETSLLGQFAWDINHNTSTPTRKLWFRASNNLGWGNDWKTIAFTDSNVASAIKLQTARTIWGAQFDGSADVGGGIGSASCLEFDGVPSYAGHGGYIDFHFNGSSADYTSRIIEFSSGRLTINDVLYVNNGVNVLIGTTTDNGYKLDVNGTARISSNLAVGGPIDIGLGKLYKYTLYDWVDGVSGFQLIDRSGNTRFGVYSYDGTKKVFVQNCYGGTENCSLELYDNGTIGLTGGNVLIGTTEDNGYKVNVKNTATASYDLHTFNSSTNSSFYVGFESLWYGTAKTSGQIFAIMSGCAYDGGGGNIVFQVTAEGNLTVSGGATFGGDVKIGSSTLSWSTNGWLNINTNVVSDGTIGMFEITSSSDARLKDNIESVSAECSLAIVRQLRPTSWSWKKNSKKAYGLIAQEVSPIIPEAVDNLGDSLHLQYNQLHAFEIGALQCIDSEVEKLKKDLKTAQEEIVVLKQQLNEYRQWQ